MVPPFDIGIAVSVKNDRSAETKKSTNNGADGGIR